MIKLESGFRIWEIDEKTRIPKLIKTEKLDYLDEIFDVMDLDNKTYAIRIGKEGLK